MNKCLSVVRITPGTFLKGTCFSYLLLFSLILHVGWEDGMNWLAENNRGAHAPWQTLGCTMFLTSNGRATACYPHLSPCQAIPISVLWEQNKGKTLIWENGPHFWTLRIPLNVLHVIGASSQVSLGIYSPGRWGMGTTVLGASSCSALF